MTFQPVFFEVSAQLIPVLFLALVVEDKVQPGSDDPWWAQVVRTWAVVLLFGAELLSLAVVAGAVNPGPTSGRNVAACMVFGGFLLMSPVLERSIVGGRRLRERAGHASAGVGLLGVVFYTLWRIQ